MPVSPQEGEIWGSEPPVCSDSAYRRITLSVVPVSSLYMHMSFRPFILLLLLSIIRSVFHSGLPFAIILFHSLYGFVNRFCGFSQHRRFLRFLPRYFFQFGCVAYRLKPLSQLRFEYTIRLRRKIDMFIFCLRRIICTCKLTKVVK